MKDIENQSLVDKSTNSKCFEFCFIKHPLCSLSIWLLFILIMSIFFSSLAT